MVKELNSTTEAAERNDATERPEVQQQQFQFPVSNSIFKECRRLGDAIWLYLFYIDRTTKERDEDGASVGLVLGGVPRSDSDSARALGVCDKTINRWRARLEREGFIRTKQTGRGSIVEVVNSKKWSWKKKKAGRTEKSEQIGLNGPIRPDEVVRADRTKRSVPYIDSTGTVQKQTETSATDVAAAWDFSFEAYKKRFDESPNWFGKDRAELKALFDRKASLDLPEFKRRWTNYLASSDVFYAKRGYALGFFCKFAWDALRDGPVHAAGRDTEERPYGGMSRKELERRRSEITPEGRRMYERAGITVA